MFDHREPAHECTGHPVDHRPAAEFGGKSRLQSAYTRGHVRLIQIKPKAPELGDFRVSFTYDYMGRRVRKVTEVWCDGVSSDSPCDGQPEGWVADPDGDIRFIYDGWNVVMERRFNGTTEDVVHKFAWGADLSGLNGAAASGSASAAVHGAGGIGGLLAVEEHDPGYVFTEPAKYLYFYDGNGNVGQVVTLDIGVFGEQPGVPPSNEGWYPAVLLGQIAARYEYDPYGGTLVASQDGWMTNPFRFSTKYYDAQPATAAAGERGLYYYGYRYYSPRMGRWVNRDPIGEAGGINMFGGLQNSPPNIIDPDGRDDDGDDSNTNCRCCCCPNQNIGLLLLEKGYWQIGNFDFKINNVINMSSSQGHVFTVSGHVHYHAISPKTEKEGNCRLEWSEYSNAITTVNKGTALNTWQDGYKVLNKSSSFNNWKKLLKNHPCPGDAKFSIRDDPQLTKGEGRNKVQTLEALNTTGRVLYIVVRIKAARRCKCRIREQSWYIRQEIFSKDLNRPPELEVLLKEMMEDERIGELPVGNPP